MKTSGRILLILFLVVVSLVGPQPVRSSLSPGVHHDLSIQLYPSVQRLTGRDVVKWDPGLGVHPFLYLNAHAKVNHVTVEGKSIPHTFHNGRLDLEIPLHDHPGEMEAIIDYEVIFSDKVPKDPIHTEDPTYGVAAVISEAGTLLLSGAGWYPHLPDTRSRFVIQVEGPAGYEAVTDGKCLKRLTQEGKSISTWKIGPTLRGVSLSAGPYVVREASVMDIPVYTYFFAEDDHLARRYLDATTKYLSLYGELFGPYPFEKFAVVENFFPTGYGFGSYTLLGRRVIRLDFILETSLGHEVAHAWWGNGVLVDYGQGNWSEAITAYVADHRFEEQASLEKGRDHRLKLLRDFATLVPLEQDFPLRAFTGRSSSATRAVGYGKGAMVFHMARRLVGEDAFWGGLKDLFARKCSERASWDDFAEAFGKQANRDMKPFFMQWVSRPGAPSLALKEVKSIREGSTWTVTGALVQRRPYFQLAVPLRLETEGEYIDAKVSITGREAPFTLRSPQPPKRLVGDPEVDIFRRLHPSEIPPTVNGIKGSTSLVAVVAETLPKGIRESARDLLMSFDQEKVLILSERETDFSVLKNADILYLGLPSNPALFPSLPKGMAISSAGFELNGRTFDRPEDALFAVFSHPERSDGVVALFLPLSQYALSPAIRKISHYGKYSYLSFRKGVNQDKGTWPVDTSPMVFSFLPQEVSP